MDQWVATAFFRIQFRTETFTVRILRSWCKFGQQMAANVFIRKTNSRAEGKPPQHPLFKWVLLVHSPTFRKRMPFLFGSSLAVHCGSSGWVISLKFAKREVWMKSKTGNKALLEFCSLIKTQPADSCLGPSWACSTQDRETKDSKSLHGLIPTPTPFCTVLFLSLSAQFYFCQLPQICFLWYGLDSILF